MSSLLKSSKDKNILTTNELESTSLKLEEEKKLHQVDTVKNRHEIEQLRDELEREKKATVAVELTIRNLTKQLESARAAADDMQAMAKRLQVDLELKKRNVDNSEHNLARLTDNLTKAQDISQKANDTVVAIRNE